MDIVHEVDFDHSDVATYGVDALASHDLTCNQGFFSPKKKERGKNNPDTFI